MGKTEHRTTIQISAELREVAAEIMRRERYRSMSELMASFLRHWALSQMPHTLTGEWAALPPEDRDAIDERLLQLVRSGAGEKGSWLNARIYDAIKEVHGPEAASPTVKQVAAKMPAAIQKALLS
jgi:hypothetical protein